MIKKLMAFLLIAIGAMASMYAFEETYTIILISVVNPQQPQFAIRNTDTGAIGNSVAFNTTEIADSNVRTSFEIIQTNDSNYRGKLFFDITASELIAFSEGKEYRTDGVRIVLNGIESLASSGFVYDYTSNLKAGNVISDFDVIWPTNPNLVSANYQALVTLTYSAD